MLKKLSKLFLGLVVCAGSACVTPTHASSASTIILVHIQAASTASAKDEMLTLYNNSPDPINITNWCLKNKSNVSFVCFVSPSGTPAVATALAYYLPAYSHLVVASESFAAQNPNSFTVQPSPFIYPVTNQSSGSIVNSSDTITLVDNNGQVVDTHSWKSTIPTGKIYSRAVNVTAPNLYQTLDPLLDWSFGPVLATLPLSNVELREIPQSPSGEGPSTPDGEDGHDDDNSDDEQTDPSNPPTTEPLLHPIITELLANPAGSDVGNEFIELFNPNATQSVSLNDYVLKVGVSLEKSYAFPANIVVGPLEYVSFNNTQIKFTLLNSASNVQVWFNGQAYGQPVQYANSLEAYSYALHNDSWFDSATPTPGAVNVITLPTEDPPESDGTPSVSAIKSSSLKPCAANQYRSIETNRCRLLSVATQAESTLAACKITQYRSPETNRCRNIINTNSTVAACKVGQERNPETNRCRNVVQMSQADHGIKDTVVQDTSTGTKWYWLLGIAGVVLLIASYAIWEWRDELSKAKKYIVHKIAVIKKVPK